MKNKKKVFSSKFPQILLVVSKFLRFFTNSWLKTKKKRSSVQKLYEIWFESTQITKKQFLLSNSRAVNTNLGVLGLDSHSSSPKPVNLFGAQSSLGGAQFLFRGAQAVIWGAWPPRNAPPWRRFCRGKGLKKSEAKDRHFLDKPFRGQEQQCSRPRSTTKNPIFLNYGWQISHYF